MCNTSKNYMNNELLKNILKVLFSNGALALLGMFTSLLFPVVLTTGDYALYQQYLLYASYLNICHLGIASGMFLNYAGKPYKTIPKEQYKSEMRLLLSVLCCFTIVGVIAAFIYENVVFLYAAFSIIPQCLIGSFLALYQAWERFSEYSIISVVPKILLIIMVIILNCLGILSGKKTIISYIAIEWIIAAYFLIEYMKTTQGYQCGRVFSNKNFNTMINGFLITFGNYVNILFHSIDKQFVLAISSKKIFAVYSFAMSMQNIMLIFISAISNPLYPRLSKGDMSLSQYKMLKELMLAMGTYSGCAYFIVSFVIKNYIGEYEDAIRICAIFFAAFPAISVINVLYTNLYKSQRKLKKYIFTLCGMIIVGVFANGIAVLLNRGYLGISFATMICYYCWLFYSQKDFNEISIVRKDYFFLIVFFISYFVMVYFNKNTILGCFMYGIWITLFNILFYGKTLKYLFGHFARISGDNI